MCLGARVQCDRSIGFCSLPSSASCCVSVGTCLFLHIMLHYCKCGEDFPSRKSLSNHEHDCKAAQSALEKAMKGRSAANKAARDATWVPKPATTPIRGPSPVQPEPEIDPALIVCSQYIHLSRSLMIHRSLQRQHTHQAFQHANSVYLLVTCMMLHLHHLL